MGYWNEVGQNLSQWPKALGKVAVAAGAGAAVGAGTGAVAGSALVPGFGTASGAGIGAAIGGIAGAATSVLAQTVDTFIIEPTDQSDFAKGLGYYDQNEYDSKVALPQAQNTATTAQADLAASKQALDKAQTEIQTLAKDKEKSKQLLKKLPEIAVMATADYVTGRISDEDAIMPNTKWSDFEKTNVYKENKARYTQGINDDKKDNDTVIVLGLASRLKAAGVDPNNIPTLVDEIKLTADEIKAEQETNVKTADPQPETGKPKPPEKAPKLPEIGEKDDQGFKRI